MSSTSSKRRILFRVDTGKSAGLGHLRRCASLANSLSRQGAYVHFLINCDKHASDYLDSLRLSYSNQDSDIGVDRDYSNTINTAKNTGADTVVVDSYKVDALFKEKLYGEGYLLVSINDFEEDINVPVILVNGNFGAEASVYDKNITALLGIKYFMLSDEFTKNGKHKPDLGKISEILVTFGAGDDYCLSSKVLDLLDELTGDFKINIITGPYTSDRKSLKQKAFSVNKDAEIVESPKSLFPFLSRCSIAFSGGGQTLYELAYMGIPTIAIGLSKDQAQNILGMVSAGAILGELYREESITCFIRQAIAKLAGDYSTRKNLSEKASSMIDGKGADRVAGYILKAKI